MTRFIALLLALLLASANTAVTVNQITGITDNNLVYSGTIPVGTDSLFFTYYGPDGVVDPDDLFTYPLIVFVGKYLCLNSALAPAPSTTPWQALVPAFSTMT